MDQTNRFEQSAENIPLEKEFNFPLEKMAFEEAMGKRRYAEALDSLLLILGNLGEDKTKNALDNPSDPNHTYITSAGYLVLRYFKHFAKDGLLKSLRAIDTIYRMYNYDLALVPEARQPDMEINKALKLAYEEEVMVKNHIKAYEWGKIGGFLNKEKYLELVSLALNNRNNLFDAHQYALEGKLYDTENQEIKSWLEELSSIDEELARIKEEVLKKWGGAGTLDIKKYKPEKDKLWERRKGVLELLLASIE